MASQSEKKVQVKFFAILIFLLLLLPLTVSAEPMDDLGVLINFSTTEGNTLGTLTGISFDDNDNVYLLSNNGQIEIYDSNFNFVRRGGSGFAQPQDITVAPNGDIYVADFINSQVDVFDNDFNALRSIETASGPVGLALASDGTLYVLLADTIVAFDTNSDDAPVSISVGVTIEGGTALAIDANDNLVVADSNGADILDSSFNLVANIERNGINDIDVDSVGNVYMLWDYSNSAQLVVYDASNNYAVIGDTGNVGARVYRGLELNGDTAYVGDPVNKVVFGYETFAPTEGIDAVFNPANGNYYLAVSGNITWSDAKVAAEAMTYQGCQGHLATINSTQENQFLVDNNMVAFYWLGGFQRAEGGWAWVTDEPFDYTNWNPGEPSGDAPQGEGKLHFFTAEGRWNDYLDAMLPEGFIEGAGYVVEFDCSSQVEAINNAVAAGELCSPSSNQAIEINVVNQTTQTLTFIWMNFDCQERLPGGVIEPGATRTEGTFVGHIFVLSNESGEIVRQFTVEPGMTEIVIGG